MPQLGRRKMEMSPFDPQHIIGYHEATKHHLHRYSRSPGYMDWENQPNPFRRYDGCRQVQLPLKSPGVDWTYTDMYRHTIPPAPVDLDTISEFLALSMGLSAWKSVGNATWSLRMNPSSGNLHPTETHLILPASETLTAGIYHYSPLLHCLERRAVLSDEFCREHPAFMTPNGFWVGLTSIFWRESWKYGERAFRYCNHDVGHALAALSLSAALKGWRLTSLCEFSDEQIEIILGLNKTSWKPLEAEHPDILCFVGHDQISLPSQSILEFTAAFSPLDFTGTPNTLSKAPVHWKIIDQAVGLTRKPPTRELDYPVSQMPEFSESELAVPAVDVIRQRRSATNFDDKGRFPRDRFLSLLARTLPGRCRPPFDAQPMSPVVDLFLFVHRVDDLSPGTYFFSRVPANLGRIKRAMNPRFLWQEVQSDFPLYRLSEKNMVHEAITVSCHQEIAGQSCFSLGMVADFRGPVEAAPYRYRYLFWETGMIGQVLYLEAEVHGFRGTGIGCFFDDEVHKIMGLTDNEFQSLYHFTIGVPVEDARLTTLPAYHHLRDSKKHGG